MSKTFIDKCLVGDLLLDELDDYILEWKNSDSSLELHEHLGFTENEYRLWVDDATTINLILYAHEKHLDINDLLTRKFETKIAARGKDFDTKKLVDWLIEIGELSNE